MKGASVLGSRCCPDAPTVRLNDGPAYRQAHAQAVRFRSEKRRKHAITILCGQPGSCILHRDVNAIVIAPVYANPHFAWTCACMGYGVKGVENQVEQNLLYLHAITHDNHVIGVEINR